jgi:hypothetical protein
MIGLKIGFFDRWFRGITEDVLTVNIDEEE